MWIFYRLFFSWDSKSSIKPPVPEFPARGMVIKVSCGGCHVGGLGYKISVNEIGAYSAGLGGGVGT